MPEIFKHLKKQKSKTLTPTSFDFLKKIDTSKIDTSKSTPESRRRLAMLFSEQKLYKSFEEMAKAPSKIGKLDPKLEKRTFKLGGKILDLKALQIESNAETALSALEEKIDKRLLFAQLDTDAQGTNIQAGALRLTDNVVPLVLLISDIPTGNQVTRPGMFVFFKKGDKDNRLLITYDPGAKSLQAKLQFNIKNQAIIALELDPTRRSMMVSGSFKLQEGRHGFVGASAGTSGNDYEGVKSQSYNLNVF